MLCIWWNFQGSVYWELLTDGHVVDRKLYSKYVDHVYDTRYLELINLKRVLLQHANAPAHKSKVIQNELADLEGIYVLPHPDYISDLAHRSFIYSVQWLIFFVNGISIKKARSKMVCATFWLQNHQNGIKSEYENWQKGGRRLWHRWPLFQRRLIIYCCYFVSLRVKHFEVSVRKVLRHLNI